MKKIFAIFAAATALVASSNASANPIHSVWSQSSPYWFVAPGYSWQNPPVGDATFAWDETNARAFASARTKLASSDVFEFKLVAVTASTAPDQIIGDWDVIKNGTVVCSSCSGDAYGLDGGIGNYFKIYVLGSTYHYSGFITDTYDF